uniref:Lymphocyte stimulatory factor 1 n=1 Tax=Nothoprocta perdicaria TaxID=30464 RepID=A0A8C6YS35_NOTPE
MHRRNLFALLCLVDAIRSRPPAATAPLKTLSEITQLVQQFNARPQIPCNDSRVAQLVFTDRKLSEQELLCQASTALSKVTKCKTDYKPLITNLQSLHSKTVSGGEIYLRNLLPELGNFTQGMYRRLAARAAEAAP